MQREEVYARLPGALLPWYAMSARDLPWRRDREPYHVWLSEIMLQQTRVEAARGYYLRFLEAFPVLSDLAAADEARLMKLWEGLGYYSRARNLQKTARLIPDFKKRHLILIGFKAEIERILRIDAEIGRRRLCTVLTEDRSLRACADGQDGFLVRLALRGERCRHPRASARLRRRGPAHHQNRRTRRGNNPCRQRTLCGVELHDDQALPLHLAARSLRAV